uniref:aralkylamine N-acetyltransferase n=1 Tax=Caenorhabditis japonica TaxID=281687 RepID=A0A8R1DLG0_CAEJA
MSLPPNYQITQLTPDHSDELCDFLMSHFLLEEPLNRAAGMSRQSFEPFVEKLFHRTLHLPFSYAVRENDTLKIVACAMSSLWKNERGDEEHGGDEFVFESKKKEAISAIGKILTELHAKFYELRPELNAVLHLEILSVSKDHQRRGLASRLMEKMENVRKIHEFECSGVASEISSLANQCLMRKRGYTTLHKVLLSTECDEASGEPLIVTDDGTDRVALVYKEF